MRLRVGNLVKLKLGGPIMMVTWGPVRGPDINCECTWVEDRQTRYARFPEHALQAVYVDGSPRNYDDEK
jgi:uncharacterized protein YodC (DUF2158 family)